MNLEVNPFNGQSWDFYHPDPYKQTSTYDVWDNLKRNGYTHNRAQNDFATYTNNRRSDSSYDAYRKELQRAARANELGGRNTRKMFIDPLGPNSPINCPP